MRAAPTLLVPAQDTLQERVKGQTAQAGVGIQGAMAASLFILRPWPCQSASEGRGYAGSQPCWCPHTCPPSPASLGSLLSRRQELSGLPQSCTCPQASGRWGSGTPPCSPDPGTAWSQQQSVFMRGTPVLVVCHPASQRSNHPDVIHNLPIL